jgi:hypothetical protein
MRFIYSQFYKFSVCLLLDLVAQRYFCIGGTQHVEVTEHISP